MNLNLIDEQIQLLSKQLKISAFSKYQDVIRQTSPKDTFNRILLSIMQKEYEQCQENNNRRRIRQASFPFTKALMNSRSIAMTKKSRIFSLMN